MTDMLPPAIILAGGLSRRMGRDKALALLGGRPLIAHVIERLTTQTSLLAINAPADFANDFGLPVVPDTLAGHPGPLAGIAAGMRHAAILAPTASHLLIVPADCPFVPRVLVSRLSAGLDAGSAIVLARSNGRLHPVVGLWPVSLAPAIEAWLTDPQNRKLMRFIEGQRVVVVDFDMVETTEGPLDPFLNINTPEDLLKAERYHEALA
ncbi:molybdenum cofactor guanylyltransferase MobA [Agrobacterium sp. a22-2]|uniref:molybdenum cofactor guanylyltransferase MobA n=1 Tax=Agrobacterium sp. a22-2 TaxID=2283840 RepID=UPI001445C4E2|nr:molybdenum cofactor guanylyltransferase MobA [Agrobacterium sp. a22-2]NKN36616.1 molybdenum cofactor guanylyltransferase MobA [Agrobacterium sp. a22-2]